MSDAMKLLTTADPETADQVRLKLESANIDPESPAVERMAGDVIYGLSVDTALGRTIADGYIRMIGSGLDNSRMDLYSRVIHRESEENTTYAVILAASLIEILIRGDDSLIDDFFRAAGLLKQKWLYALSPEPLNVVSEIIGPDDTAAAKAWLAFLCDVFTHDLTYNQFRRFSGIFPKAVRNWPAEKRSWRIAQIRRVVRRDFNLACIFADALNRELSLLAKDGLEIFVTEGLARYRQDETRGAKFLGLSTRSALDACHRLRTTGVLSLNKRQLTSYLQARCGRPISIRPISALGGLLPSGESGGTLVCFDGRTIYLADEINRYPGHQANDFLYKSLAWIEAGLLEFGTFDFDLEKLAAAVPTADLLISTENNGSTDMDRFFLSFADPEVARDLFTVFEYGRIRTLLENAYPGGAARYFPPVREAAEKWLQSTAEPGLMSVLFALIVPQTDEYAKRSLKFNRIQAVKKITDIFQDCTAGVADAEASAAGVLRALSEISRDVFLEEGHYRPLTTPFGLRVRPELFYAAFAAYEKQAGLLKEKLVRLSGESLHKSEIRRKLTDRGGMLSADDIREMIQAARKRTGRSDENGGKWLTNPDLEQLYGEISTGTSPVDGFTGETYRYHEWDRNIGDYLADHVLVRNRAMATGDTHFYQTTLSRNNGLVKKIRYAFEMLKPEGMSILRKWREGDDFDYRRLLEYAVDKKTGRTPSDRIYIKRLKQQRDVAVLLLLDFSRSTSNLVAGSDSTMVLDVEKEALVLFCEALSVTGDAFAIAGFSGTGRLGVDYFPVKSFEEPLSKDVEQRIGIISPQRNTRMGAAVRHATSVFSNMTARTKLMIIISDGFPNDIDYKRDYALADTRRALLEARTRGIIVHSITINIAGDSRLDDLYGRVRHSVISDVRELPDRLIRIYGRLTG